VLLGDLGVERPLYAGDIGSRACDETYNVAELISRWVNPRR